MTRAFFVGRFQPFHEGHQTIIEDCIAPAVDELVVGVGSADRSHEVENPFTAGERVVMVTRALEPLDLQHYVVPIEDIDRNALWVSHVESMTPPFDVVYSNNPLVVRLFGEAGVEVRQTDLFERSTLEGTEIRERMLAGEDWAHLVPDAVTAVIEGVDGVERIREVDGSDAAGEA